MDDFLQMLNDVVGPKKRHIKWRMEAREFLRGLRGIPAIPALLWERFRMTDFDDLLDDDLELFLRVAKQLVVVKIKHGHQERGNLRILPRRDRD